MKKKYIIMKMPIAAAVTLLTLGMPVAASAADAEGCPFNENVPEHESYAVIVTADVLNVRAGQSTMSDIVMQVKQDECYPVIGEPVNGWYPIRTGYVDGWVCGDYIERTAQEPVRESDEGESYQAAAMNHILTGQQIADYACQFIGNPYVWGGTSLTEGADCSGFVQSVYRHFGIGLPRTTYEMVYSGREVPYEDAVPGDLILYDGHVGIYLGEGNIVNAMNEEDGIGICSAEYAEIITVRRVL